MGMFDSIKPDKAWCPFCGNEMDHPEFQSNDGSCDMTEYFSWEAFGESIPHQMAFSAYTQCPNCKRWVELLVNNESPSAKEYQSRGNEEARERWLQEDKRLSETQAAMHPNHPVSSQGIWDRYLVSNAYCPKCKEEGIGSGDAHPDNVFVKAKEEARERFLQEHPNTCKDCGKEIFPFGLGNSQSIAEKIGANWPHPLCDNHIISRILRGE